MRVKKLIEDLQRLDPELELFVEYWDKETVQAYGTSREMTDDEWSEVVDKMEDGEFAFQSYAADQLVDTAEEVIRGTT